MTTLTLQVENPLILAHLKVVLKSIKGVKVLSINNSLTPEDTCEEIPNAMTLAAMKEAESGNDAGVVQRIVWKVSWLLLNNMKEIRKTSQFKKDFKRFAKDVEKVKTLMSIVEKLERGEFIPDEFYPHPLKGEWKNYMECHIDDDYLLIWFDKEESIVRLVRLGSHSELFGKRKKR